MMSNERTALERDLEDMRRRLQAAVERADRAEATSATAHAQVRELVGVLEPLVSLWDDDRLRFSSLDEQLDPMLYRAALVLGFVKAGVGNDAAVWVLREIAAGRSGL